MYFHEIKHEKPVLVLANGKSLQEAPEAELQEAAKKCTVIAVNGAGRVRPDIRFFLDAECHLVRYADMRRWINERGKGEEKWAGRKANWTKITLDYNYDDRCCPWNNTFLACLWVVLNNSEVNAYVLGGDCNPDYSDEVIWSLDYKSVDGQNTMVQHEREHVQRVIGGCKNDVGEIMTKFPDRLFSLCGKHGKLSIPECGWGNIK